MIRLTADPEGEGCVYTLTRGAELLLTTTDRSEAAEKMLQFGVDNPLHLIEFAETWRAVDVVEGQGGELT